MSSGDENIVPERVRELLHEMVGDERASAAVKNFNYSAVAWETISRMVEEADAESYLAYVSTMSQTELLNIIIYGIYKDKVKK